jgi:hypothetical protein
MTQASIDTNVRRETLRGTTPLAGFLSRAVRPLLLRRGGLRVGLRLEQALLLERHVGEPQIALACSRLESSEGILFGELECRHQQATCSQESQSGAVVAAVLTESRPRVAETEPAEDAVFAEAA